MPQGLAWPSKSQERLKQRKPIPERRDIDQQGIDLRAHDRASQANASADGNANGC